MNPVTEPHEPMKSPINRLMDEVQWAPVEIVIDDKLPGHDAPFATHVGELVIGEIRIKCWRLNTGQSVVDPDALEKLFPGWQELFEKTGNEIPEPIAFKP